jgi:hypothetical protein
VGSRAVTRKPRVGAANGGMGMAHVLARLSHVKVGDIKQVLKTDAAKHAEQGLYLEHLWQNVDDPEEVLFLFRTDDLAHAKRFVEKVHAQALNEDPHINLPQMAFLEEQ